MHSLFLITIGLAILHLTHLNISNLWKSLLFIHMPCFLWPHGHHMQTGFSPSCFSIFFSPSCLHSFTFPFMFKTCKQVFQLPKVSPLCLHGLSYLFLACCQLCWQARPSNALDSSSSSSYYSYFFFSYHLRFLEPVSNQ